MSALLLPMYIVIFLGLIYLVGSVRSRSAAVSSKSLMTRLVAGGRGGDGVRDLRHGDGDRGR